MTGMASLRGTTEDMKRAHRVAFELTFPEWNGKEWVLHRCDNPPCCNPAHLFLGTPRDNAVDMIAKGRRADTRGENHGSAKLTAAQVLEIRASKLSSNIIADQYGVSGRLIRVIRQRVVWRHL